MKENFNFRADADLKDAFREVCETQELSMSEVLRSHMREVVDEGKDALDDEQLREVEVARLKAEGRDESSDARKRVRVVERVKGMMQQPYSVDEIERDLRSYIRVDEVEGRDERARFFRGLLEMVELFRGYDEWGEREDLPASVYAAVDKYALAYADGHIEYVEDLADLADKETNGYLADDDMTDEAADAIEDAMTPDYDDEGGRYNLL
jgi:antitoxin component of RelBE/YafQ-DinJ toxin-antitoxin module